MFQTDEIWSPICPDILGDSISPFPTQSRRKPAVTEQSASTVHVDAELTAEVEAALANWPVNTANPRRTQV
ncbi:hypothetical protein GCM10027589_43220 [Actinocorallia lasiicapitis]